MKRWAISISLLLIALTNLVVVTIDGFAPITAFILYIPVVVCFVLMHIYTRSPILDNPEAFILAGYLFIVSVINIDEVRWSSLGFSILFCVFFLFTTQYQHLISKEYFQKIGKIIIFLYATIILLSQISFHFTGGLESLQWLFQGVIDSKTGTMRFYGFSSEPSYAAFVVIVAFYTYIKLSKEERLSKAIVILSVSYLTVCFHSIYGYILLGAVAFESASRNKVAGKTVLMIFLLVISIGITFIIGIISIKSGEHRMWNLILFIIAGNWSLENLRFLDSSAFMRVGPIISYLKEIDLISIQTYLGYGPGKAAIHFGNMFYDMIDASQKGYETSTIQLGFFPAFLYDYGIVGAILVYLFVLRRGMHKFISIESFIFFLMLFNANFNTQLFWYVWAMLFVMNQILRRESGVDMRVNNLSLMVSKKA